MRFPDLVVGHVVDAHEQLRLVRPPRYVPVEKRPKGRAGPRIGVNPVRDRMNGVSVEHVLGHLAVFLGDAIYVTTQVKGKHGHIQFGLPRKFAEKFVIDGISHDAPDFVVAEAIVSRSYGCMCGEYTSLPNSVVVPL